jgi:N-methylhydantoinase A
VTDANLVLGYLNADYFLGGAMQVSLEAARAAVDEHLALPLGLTIEEAAAGVHEIVNANMAAAIRVVTIERGIDPRGFTLVASGGAGPAHVVRLAEAFDIPQVLVPANPGVGSAIGLVVSDVVFDSVRTRVLSHADIDPAVIDALYRELTDAARSQVRAEGFDDENIRIEREIDVRFRHQAHELGVHLDDGEITPATLVQAEAMFRDTYERLYGVRPSDPVEFVNYRVRAVGRVDKPDWAVDAQAHGPATPVSQRAVHFGEHEGFIDTPVYRRSSLAPGHVIEGPAIVEEPTSSIVVPPKWTASVDQRLNLIIRR